MRNCSLTRPARLSDQSVAAGWRSRPESIGEKQLGVSRVPEEEVADALLAASADEQLRVRESSELQVAGKALLVDVLRP
jgi:hypothetical protein